MKMLHFTTGIYPLVQQNIFNRLLLQRLQLNLPFLSLMNVEPMVWAEDGHDMDPLRLVKNAKSWSQGSTLVFEDEKRWPGCCPQELISLWYSHWLSNLFTALPGFPHLWLDPYQWFYPGLLLLLGIISKRKLITRRQIIDGHGSTTILLRNIHT